MSLWKDYKNNLYEMYAQYDLPYPSLTFEWIDDYNFDTREQRFISGTHTGGTTESLWLGKVQFPEEDYPFETTRSEIIKSFPHNGPVHVARHCPRFNNIIASAGRKLAIYNTDEPSNSGPLVSISYHTDDCWALSFSPYEWATLLSGAEDGRAAVWDLHVVPAKTTGPVWESEVYQDLVNDIQWHPKQVRVFGAALETGEVAIQDIRQRRKTVSSKPERSKKSKVGLNTISFSPLNENLLATGDTEKNAQLFDIRYLEQPLHTLKGHDDAIVRVQWNPDYDGVLATASDDTTVAIWDIKKIGKEQEESLDWLDGPPELLFKHRGHTCALNDLCWNPCRYWNLGTIGRANESIVWTPKTELVSEEESNILLFSASDLGC